MNRATLMSHELRPDFGPGTENWPRWARLRFPVLLRGERGTGKSRLAEEIHRASGRTGRFVARSLEAIPRGLEIAELLGHRRGAFTGAVADRAGAIAQADRGTVFLDELGRASLEAQGALLGFLDHGHLAPVGATREVACDARVVAATNANLETMVAQGSFLADLLDRFGYYVIVIRPLRDRREEILPLTRSLLERESRACGRDTPELTGEVKELLRKAPWPGNIRELVKLCQYVVGNAGLEAEIEHLPPTFLLSIGKQPPDPIEPLALRARRMLETCGGNKTEAARRLGKSRGHFYRLLHAARGAAAG